MMNLCFQDRISGRKTETIAGLVTLGQYRVLVDGASSLNAVPLESGGYLIPDQEGRWKLLVEGGQSLVGEFPPNQLPALREQSSLRQIGGRLEGLVDSGATWQELAEVPPIVPEVLEKAQMQPLDNAIEQYLCHLQEVCRHPRIHLKMETERVPVPRARRISSRAVEHLASHTEDWQHRKLTSVVPKRILAVVADDQYDIYENRVAVRLVDHLHQYLCERLEEIKKLQRLFDDVKSNAKASHWRLKRVFGLLGQAVLDEGSVAAAKTRRSLESLRYQILQLFGSLLYKAVPTQLQVPPSLKVTNIFANDRHYRYVGLLWRTWLRFGFKQPKTRVQRYQDRQDLCKDFVLFCALLICRGLVQSGYSPKGLANLVPGTTCIPLLNGLGDETALFWNEDDTFTIKKNGQSLIHFVPLVAALALEPDAEHVEKTLRNLLDLLPPQSPNDFSSPLTVILYSSDAEQRQRLPFHLQQRLQSLGNDLAQPSSVGLVPVSTYEIDSVERVARAIRWRALGSQMMDYPPTIPIPVSYADELTSLAKWIQRTNRKDLVRVVRLPSSEEQQALQQWLAEERSALSKARKTSRYRVKQLTDFEGEHSAALAKFATWLRCPVCSGQNDSRYMKTRQDDHFEIHCIHCPSSWGTRACGQCHRRYPFLAVGDKASTHRPQYSGWVDDVLGMDVLASPCWLPDSTGSYICPWCGTCRNESSPDCDKCLRCSQQ